MWVGEVIMKRGTLGSMQRSFHRNLWSIVAIETTFRSLSWDRMRRGSISYHLLYPPRDRLRPNRDCSWFRIILVCLPKIMCTTALKFRIIFRFLPIHPNVSEHYFVQYKMNIGICTRRFRAWRQFRQCGLRVCAVRNTRLLCLSIHRFSKIA